MTPQLSILMSVRNEERYLPATLDSLRRQSLAGWELVVIDDGRIVQEGTHDALIASGGLYAALYARQFEEVEPLR